MLTVGSLFSGVGGIDLGLERAGMRVVWQAEIDPFRRAVLRAHWPDVPCFEDVRQVAEGALPRRLRALGGSATGADARRGRAHAANGDDRADVVCGGFPCQDVSIAGRRAGLQGERSSLFFEFARVADAVRPRWLVLENVPGLLTSHGGRDFALVVRTLVDLGYGVAWRVLDSRFFGVAQRRRRVFVVGRLGADSPESFLPFLAGGDGHPASRAEARQNDPRASLSGLGTGGPDDNDGQAGRLVISPLQASSRRHGSVRGQPSSDEVDQLVPSALGVRKLTTVECCRLQGFPDDWLGEPNALPDGPRYAAMGDAVTVPVAEWIGRAILEAEAST